MSVAVEGVRYIPATPEMVWAALEDVDRLALCIPGCRELEPLSPSLYRLSVPVQLGPVRVEFRGTIERVACDPPMALTLVGRGRGGLAGMAVGSARITLAACRAGCRLAYTVTSEPSGPFATLGSFFLIGIAQALTDTFLSSLADLVRVEVRPAPTHVPRG